MTVVDLFISLPIILKITVGIFLGVWAIEAFILPFKFNLLCKRSKEVETLLRLILKAVGEANGIKDKDRKIITALFNKIEKENKIGKRKKKSNAD